MLEKTCGIRSPLTHEWFELALTDTEFVKYYEYMSRILEVARDIQPMKQELTPWDDDECRLFGLRNPKYRSRVIK